MKTYQLWARVGVTVKATEQDAKRISEDPEGFMRDALKSGLAFVDGDTYFTPQVEENRKFAEDCDIEFTE